MTAEARPQTPNASVAGALERSVIVAFSLPMAGFMAVSIPLSLYLMKFSTDVLLLAPGAIGLVMGAARIWDAVSDPLAGNLSDRTRSRWGRRRSWMLAAALPIALSFAMIWSPPDVLPASALVVWIAASILIFETASTGFIVPYGALGMELTDRHHERTRIFAYRHVIGALGLGLGLGFVYLLRTADSPRDAGLGLALCLGGLLAASIVYAALRVPERPDHQGRGGVALGRAFADVFRNRHARLFLAAHAVESFGQGTIGVLGPYIVHYLIGDENLLEPFILAWAVPQFALTPLWLHLARRIGKKRLWLFGMAITAVAFSGILAVEEGSFGVLLVLAVLFGIGLGIPGVVGPSVQADVIDYDELQTGERKEGTYTAVTNFLRKAGAGISVSLVGIGLQIAGFEPNVDQTPAVRRTIVLLAGVLPASCYAIGFLLFSRFGLDEREHDRVLAQIRSRRAAGNHP